jgi:hypothetical protein
MEIDGHGRKGRQTDRNGMRMDAMTIEQCLFKGEQLPQNYHRITENYREITGNEGKGSREPNIFILHWS